MTNASANAARPHLSLLTDLYQLTMAYGYWKQGVSHRDAAFHLTFRKLPFAGGYAIACGLQAAIEYLANLRFNADDLDYLATLEGNDRKPLFDQGFLEHLRDMKFTCDVDAIPEGTAVFAHEPLIRVTGPIIQAQIVETALLNLINFQTLIATKASRICHAAAGDPVIEFGLRRAQGIDGALAASRSAYVGGCVATSNVLAGQMFDIPVRGTHAHSWVMSFDTELQSFEEYARAMPNNCVFLVDTYDTLDGVRHAVEIGRKLRGEGHEMVGIRLDSGDLAYLSIEARKILDAGGFSKARILASNDLDEQIITSLKQQGAKIDTWGVGTRLVTAYDQPALGGVYKLGAIREDSSAPWTYRLKLSEQSAKTSNPGILQVRRYRDPATDLFVADAIYEVGLGIEKVATIIDPVDSQRHRTIRESTQYEDLLAPIFREGKQVYAPPAIDSVRNRAAEQLAALHPAIKRFLNPHTYPAGLERQLFGLKTTLIERARNN